MIKEIYGKKIGMTQLFNDEGDLLSTTLLQVDPVYLLDQVDYRGKRKVRIGCFKIDEKRVARVKKPVRGYFAKLKTSPCQLIKEVDLEEGPCADKPGDSADSRQIGVDIFKEGDIVDVRARTKGKGFAGGMKRYGWSGQPKSHGSTSHRRIGSAGASAYPSKIIKGIHMPGHMGNRMITTKNLAVLKVDKDKNILFVNSQIQDLL